MKHQNHDTESTAVKVLAAASATPFWTAFKVTMGIAIAQLTILVVSLSLLALGGYTLLSLLTK